MANPSSYSDSHEISVSPAALRARKMQHQRLGRIGRLRLSPLQSKGMLLLLLVIISESVTLTKAVQFWSTIQGNGYSEPDRQPKRFLFQDNSGICKANDMSCSNSNGHPISIPGAFGKLTKRIVSLVPTKSSRNCCTEFQKCISKSTSSNLQQECTMIPRGGHSTAKAAADAAADLVASKMPYNIPLNGWKVIFQAFLTTLNVVCWLVPLQSKKISDNKLALSLANAFSGGVFLSLAFGHLIPECVHGFEGMNYNEVTPYLLVLSGYLLIFFVEKVAFDAHEILHEMEHAQDHKAVENGSSDSTVSENGSTSGRSALILLGALAVHSILEMAALGLADSFTDSAILTLSIALHQPAESIALLVAFLKSGMPKGQIIRFLSIFSAMGPIGVAMGMAVNEFAAPIVDSIMVAVVAGTFVYVGATEVIPEEWEDTEHKWKKFFALMSGIVSILIITQYTMTLG
ncbi:ZIP zinc transporter [Nitzschia inconspicua]|uniref:ZIP zinc transporter n=1 Tax=Nitzschia inconspicua TaxID=303405 RepID=A0A9K3KYJ9_9STRA|nr:ZIP zinc transporter [Nitzschia inconspicua]